MRRARSSVDFQREHKLGSGVSGTIVRSSEAGGDGGLYLRERDHSHIKLGSDVAVAALLIGAEVGSEACGEEREPCPVEVELGGTEVAEVQGREVPFGLASHERLSADLVDLCAGEAVVLAVPADLAFVDPVVAEGSEVEVGEGIVLIAEGAAGGCAEPE